MDNTITKLKFYLGLKCVMRYGNKGWVVTKRQGGLVRVCKSTTEDYWWGSSEYYTKYCLFPTKEAAIQAMKTKRFSVGGE